jgi:hypothetical protein
MWRSEFALTEEAVPDLGIARSRLAVQDELRSWYRGLQSADMRHSDSLPSPTEL